MSAPSRRRAHLLARAKHRHDAEQYVERLVQRTAARGIEQIEQHLKEMTER